MRIQDMPNGCVFINNNSLYMKVDCLFNVEAEDIISLKDGRHLHRVELRNNVSIVLEDDHPLLKIIKKSEQSEQ